MDPRRLSATLQWPRWPRTGSSRTITCLRPSRTYLREAGLCPPILRGRKRCILWTRSWCDTQRLQRQERLPLKHMTIIWLGHEVAGYSMRKHERRYDSLQHKYSLSLDMAWHERREQKHAPQPARRIIWWQETMYGLCSLAQLIACKFVMHFGRIVCPPKFFFCGMHWEERMVWRQWRCYGFADIIVVCL